VDGGNERRGRSLAGADLSGEDLRESHLTGADLSGARLVGSNLHGLDLRGTCLRDARLDGADLRDALLEGASLRAASLADVLANGSRLCRADLSLAHLAGADFRSADLAEALLTDADLSRARFERANLYDANLIGAELGGASFHDAVLIGANLRESHLDGADFRGARLAFTVFAASDLSRARGLDAVVHDGPSTLGVDAFLMSRGEIPDAFLVGIGLSPLTIEYLKAVAVAEEGMLVGDASFLLFADSDRPYARRLRAYLRMHRHPAWYSSETEELAGRHNSDLNLRIRFHDRLIVLASAAATVDSTLGATIARGLEKERAEERRIVVAVRIDDFTAPGVLEGLGAGRFVADFRGSDWEDPRDTVFRRELERLLRALDDSGE
jgi:uncharacterized protein YjbI with pentapeptide repeats